MTKFRDRREGGVLLADKLTHYAKSSDTIVLGLPRGGVPVAYEVAKKLDLPLDVFVVRKLGLPSHPELAMGAIATGNVRVLNQEVVQYLAIPDTVLDAVTAKEKEELQRRELAYRGHNKAPKIKGKTVILVDDGVATGSSMQAAVRALRQQSPKRIIIAVPTASPCSCHELGKEADEVIALIKPIDFQAVGQYYEEFSQTTDQEVIDLLKMKIESHK
ncbi:MAG: phosphoribosyl transferase [Verrucomicrobia bacterium RIFCSPHIGHO2_12_FULL_41_10]|nr:MAG: phosphoribosyl transferase [Verrucomicrobia bacterium RIFCSPHIGHO2_12_FULL_41_10]